MQIRSLFLVCMSVVAALGACLGGWMLTQMVLEYRLAGRVERAVEIDRLLFIASDKLANERPITGNALLGELPPDPATRARLSSVRQDADSALRKLEASIAARQYQGSAPQLAIVREAGQKLEAWRKVVDAALEQPKRLRPPGVFAQYLEGVNAVFGSMGVVLDMGDLAAALHDGTSVELIALSRLVWSARSTMGLRTVPLIAAIDSGIALDPPKLEVQARYDGMFAATWPPIAAIDRRLPDMPSLNAAVARGRDAFEAYDRLCHDVIAASRDGTPYPVSALDLGKAASRTATVMLAIRDEALDAALDRVVHNRETAAIYVLIAGIVLALTIFATVFVLMLLQRRIVSPMLALTEVIGRIARLEFDVLIPARDRGDEIGRMALALDELRSGAMAGEANKVRLVHLARHDALTGLSNRVTMQEKLDQAVEMAARGTPSAALCLDLDRFKEVNDTFGHPTGDRLLKAVAERLLACVREVDTVSRLGGDEFVVLLFGIDQADDASVVAGRIVQALNQPFNLDGQVVSVGVSVGIALTPQDANAGIDLLKRADTALYRAKSEEKGSWRFFRPEMDAHLHERSALERDLRDAVRNDGFSLVYQPQYRLSTDRGGIDQLCGFEALLRWRHPERGWVNPGVFIPVAEETGLIEALGAWVLEHACAEATGWPDHVKLAVNMSGVQFKTQDVLQTVRDVLARSGLAAHRLELEITESVLLTNTARNVSILHAFRNMGIHIAMDDFGTGYSSLSYLRSFPFDVIKIDRSFVLDLCEDHGSREIVHAIVSLANSLGMTTTAEGVETPEQLAELRRQGCTDVQGFLLSRPMPAGEAMRLLSRATAPDTAVA